jgi:hypothetical protein
LLRWVRGLVVAAASLVLGAAVALCVVALHGYAWGLVLGLATTAACLVALPGGAARFPFGFGWAMLTLLATQHRAEGDFVVATDAPGWVLLGAAPVVLVCSMIGARRHAAPAAPPGSGPPDSR